MLSTYAAKYRSLKAPRKLQWRPSLGTVSLELAIGDQTLEFNVRAGTQLEEGGAGAAGRSGNVACMAATAVGREHVWLLLQHK